MDGMKAMLRITLALVAVLVLVAAGVYYYREALAGRWIGRELGARLSAALGATVEFDGIEWKDNVLYAARCRVSGGDLPFDSLKASKLRTDLDWNRLRDPFGQPLSVEAATAEIALRPAEKTVRRSAAAKEMRDLPALDFSIARFSLLQPGQEGWSLRDTALRAKREGGAWSFTARGGAVTFPGLPPLRLKQLAAKEQGKGWAVESFAVNDEGGGEVSGSVRQNGGVWSGKFAWKNLDTTHFLKGSTAEHFAGKCSGTAALEKGALSGRMTISGAETRAVPALVKMASLFVGEKWDSLPWETLDFAFVREADGTIRFSDLTAISPKGLIVRGSGRIASDSLAAELELGVRREGRPWLVAFIPVLFRGEREGYFWTPVRVGGTVEAPTEDLTTRVVAALAVAPAAGAVKGATEVPANVIEAAGSLLDALMGK